MKIDFSQISYEDLESIAEDLLVLKGFTISSRSARGPDRGKDIIAVRDTTDDMGIVEREVYLVECKHFSLSGRSVRETDIGNWYAKMQIHGANKYLLITSSTVSETVKDQLAAMTKAPADVRKAAFWNKSDLIELLQQHEKVRNKYFFSWESEADAAANYLYNHHFSAHRGAICWCPGITVIFGNDGYDPEDGEPFNDANQRSRDEVVQLRRQLEARGLDELAFGKSQSGYTWVILVRHDDTEELHKLVWTCYPTGSSNNQAQHNQTFVHLHSYWHFPHKEHCGDCT
ncbi:MULTISPECIES: restriction endonuclease [Thalassomonas]|uniref:Restriction endonuclease n=1 Tax=Thalassomonas actiniarum TaxID=485447 RepID=A0AAE9YJB7_9GAMM|nr:MULTISPECIES: restriction endonuclease [Thalassomonas]WDD96777.1 restriction endonuclease [Thalassomonas actiniarum]